jgi:outer membrane protein assembly factor BamB
MFGYVSCYDRATGRLIWERADLHARDASIAIYRNRLFLQAHRPRPNPTKWNKNISGCACLELDGTLVWFADAMDNVTTQQVAIQDDVLIFGDQAGFISALDVNNGRLVWQADLKPWFAQLTNPPARYISGNIMISGSTIVTQSQSTSHFFGLDMASGAVSWMHNWRGKWDQVATCDIDNWGCDDQHLYYIRYYTTWACVDITTGQIVWDTGELAWPAIHTSEKTGAVIGDYYFAGFEPMNIFAAFDTHTGQVAWEFRAESAVTGSPSWINGRLLIGCGDGHVYAFVGA